MYAASISATVDSTPLTTSPQSNVERVVEFAKKMPKVEMHLHLEGTFQPSRVIEIANRNHIALPEKYDTLEKLKSAYIFTDLFAFLELYGVCASVLKTEQDFEELMFDYLKDAHSQNISHAEVFVGYQLHLARGIEFATIHNGIVAAMAKAKEKFGITSSIILDVDRGLEESDAERLLTMAKPYIGTSVVGIGLAYAENAANPPSKFANVYRTAHSLGLHLVAHAGEAMGAHYVKEAIRSLRVERVDHGVRALEDLELISELAQKEIALTLCPLSNVCLQVYKSLAEHRIRELILHEVPVTINSDDPAYFGGNLNDNFEAIIREHNFTLDEIYGLARNSVEFSFLPLERKDEIFHQLETIYKAYV